ncbi:CDP-diacylglycerol--serine O-phosphatidyltransferase [Rheinheimera riviphila]|uniref:CDP-diacylglycerol--serine O-phosphatidyltransferase n=1 Tax=Rheinheimera riviphila TaxID=1834037 RepID=A0A437QEU6_9GAMM|nr:CDP-diacylglycerol--serine O-phosphatidyltransferase [Rheinheimera riviphila]RVU33077.1 CDP-diacylglycerol--serine O-phosphatidyltransferase [Rheinheimera riviphila]
MLQNLLNKRRLAALPRTVIEAPAVQVLCHATEYKERLLSLIATARQRIIITALYLQADEAGEQILRALYVAKQQNPALQVIVYVDFHRARRGLIGQAGGRTNADFYRAIAAEYPEQIQIFGVPVKKRELFGVLHLKGFVFDDTLFYSGASLNNIYLAEQQRYRADRYLQIDNKALADAFAAGHQQVLGDVEVVQSLLADEQQIAQAYKATHRSWLKQARLSRYPLAHQGQGGALTASLLMGMGRLNNQLNQSILALLAMAERDVLIYTPYFNPPPILAKALRKCLKRGVKVTIVVGDKTANDFYIPPGQKFSRIGGLPYLYETILRKFVKSNQNFIDDGLLNIRLWRHADNSYHLKGLSVDGRRHLFTGHNFNPRAFALDFENGILVDDELGQLQAQLQVEQTQIFANTKKVDHFTEIEMVRDYPEQVRKLLGKIKGVGVALVVKRLI